MSRQPLSRQTSRDIPGPRLADLPEDDVEQEADINEFIPTPPDGGWGWMVVLASFMNHFILDGIAYAFGSFMMDYAEFFQSSVAATGALMSTLIGCYMLSAPVASALINKFGCRFVGILGSVIAASSFVMCTFSKTINVMIVIFGVCGGIGFGLMYIPAVVSVSMYFEKKRPLAIGIAMCGTGVGTFTFGSLGSVLLQHFRWQEAHFFLAAFILHGCVFSCLMRPLRTEREIKVAREKRKAEKVASSSKNISNSIAGSKTTVFQRLKSPKPTRTSQSQHNLQTSSVTVFRSSTKLGGSQHRFGTKLTIEEADDLKRPLYRKDVFYSGSVYNIKEFREHPDVKEFVASITSIPAMRDQHTPEPPRTFLCSCLPRQLGDVLAEMLDLSIFKNMAFVLISVLALILMMAYLIPFAYTSARAESLGVPIGKASFLISIIGLSTTIGRPLACLLAQLPQVKPLLVHNIMVAFAGLSCVVVPFCRTYELMAIAAFAYGLFIGGHVSLSPIVMLDYMGLDKLTTAYGLLTLVRGISTLVGPPVAGLMYDKFQSYDMSFYIAGGLLLFVAIGYCLLSLRCLRDKYSQANDRA